MKLRPYQQDAIDATIAFLNSDRGNPIIALPTGTGKSVVIGGLLKRLHGGARARSKRFRSVMLTHSRHLIEQNARKYTQIFPNADLGIHCAGLHMRDWRNETIFASVQSIAKHPEVLGDRQLGLIDECHLVNARGESTMYMKAINATQKICPWIKWVGLSATPWRCDNGPLVGDGVFDDYSIDLTKLEDFNALLKAGYMKPVVPKRTATTIDTSNVRTHGARGDFVESELAKVFDVDDVNTAIVREIVAEGAMRKHWMVFAINIAHANHLRDLLALAGIDTGIVHSKLESDENDRVIADFKASRLRALVNIGCLTTGFDFAPIDLIAVVRPTRSVVLWVQMLGRGTRPEGINCKVLDFGGCALALGPINDPKIPRRKGESDAGGGAPCKCCPECDTFIAAGFKACPECGYEFPEPEIKIRQGASEQALIVSSDPVVEIFDVQHVTYHVHISRRSGLSMMRADYHVGQFDVYSEYVCIEHEHGSFAYRKACEWFAQRLRSSVEFGGMTFREIAQWIESNWAINATKAVEEATKLPFPAKIRVHLNPIGDRYPKILDTIFADQTTALEEVPF